ncbi:MAG TPA: ABC transporter substrate-binding protein, partial [Acidimicrobiia bacterium]|nr:ABC transporter substrate-binding protein [Acidimicrobiia bacterium]
MSRRISRGMRATALISVLVFVAAACGSSGGSSKSGGTSPPASIGGLSAPNESSLTPVNGGDLTYGIEADTSGGYCLYKAQLAIGGIQVARAIYDTLTIPGQDGKIHPFLAKSVVGSNNNKTWTITLRPGIKFHDGTELNAEVVKENLDHYRKENPLFVFVFPSITSVDVVDNMTVKVESSVSWTAFPWFLWSSSRLGIMAKAQMDSPDCNTKLIGTGPFMCQGACQKFGQQTTVKRNPNYWLKDDKGNQLPYLNSIKFVPQEDGPKRLSSLQAGDFQAIHTSGPHQIVQIRKDVKDGSLADVESDKYAEVGYIMLNTCGGSKTQDPVKYISCGQGTPFSHKSAREAVAYGIDRNLFNHIANEDILQQAYGPFAPGAPGYVDDGASLWPKFDPAKAKAAAAQYQTETGKKLTFTLNHTADPDTTADAKLVKQMLHDNVGIDIALNPVADQSTLINIAVGRNYDATLWRNHPGADPDTQYVW